MIEKLPLVSVIIPCRNEENFVSKCLDSLIKQDFPKENLEILLIDGMSEDKTREIIENYAGQYSLFRNLKNSEIKTCSFIKLLENPKKFTPFGLNIGIKNAKGEVIIRMDAHATYEKDYISKCVKYLKEYKADNVGGVIKTLPAENTLIAKAISICLSHRFGVGGSYFRLGLKKPKEVDTVFGGCYKKEVFEKIGLFDERLIKSQDIEFNKRLKKAGGKIVLVPDIVAYYYPQATLSGFLKHNFIDGIWTTYPLKFAIKIFSLRHLIPLFFVLGLILSLLLSLISKIFFFFFLSVILFYLLVSLFFSLIAAIKEKNFQLFFVLPLAFASRHFGYGLGSFWGLIKVLF